VHADACFKDDRESEGGMERFNPIFTAKILPESQLSPDPLIFQFPFLAAKLLVQIPPMPYSLNLFSE
jgi:hypothetical protein